METNCEAQRLRQTHARIGWERMAAVVDDFYDRVQAHPTLAVPFLMVSDWTLHKARLTHFWWVALGGRRYRPDRYDVAGKHLAVGVNDELVDDWLELFHATLREHLPGDLAEAWFRRARLMGGSVRQSAAFYRRKAVR
ncbi:MAG: group III truncated hemoglobin [Gammaproteobacteria bacterium]